MPSNMLAIDTNFPTFTGEEPVEETIRELLNYMFQLRESLQYSLQNLSADNFNTIALNNITDGVKNEINEQLKKLMAELNQLQQQLRIFEARMAGVEVRTADAEKDIADIQLWSMEQERKTQVLEDWAQNTDGELGELNTLTGTQQQSINNLEELLRAVDADVAELQGAVQTDSDGSVTIGSAQKELRLVGTIYINGVLFEGGSA